MKIGIIGAFYLILVNFAAVMVTLVDKTNAKLHRYRVRESTLLALGLIGGCFGEYITMVLIRHKTKKPKFMLGLPLMCLLYTAIIFAYYLLLN